MANSTTGYDEFSLAISAFIAIVAIALRVASTVIKRNEIREVQVFRRSFGLRRIQGDEIILVSLIIPFMMQMIFYFLLSNGTLPQIPASLEDNEIRQSIVRSCFLTTNIITAVYFLNGRLSGTLRRIIRKLWNRLYPIS